MSWYLHFRPPFLPTLDGPDPAGLLQGAENLDLCLGFGLGVCDRACLLAVLVVILYVQLLCVFCIIYLLYYTLPKVMCIRWAVV